MRRRSLSNDVVPQQGHTFGDSYEIQNSSLTSSTEGRAVTMALIQCHECGERVSTTAQTCPSCGAPVSIRKAIAASPSSTAAETPPHRAVGIPLALGILLIPYIFSWFLLRSGYSREARLLGFGWPILLVLLVNVGRLFNGGNSGMSSISNVDVDPHLAAKEKAVLAAKQAVRSALKETSSAEFGTVNGVSATVACGFVNAKNSFGAMTGETMFIFDAGSVTFDSEAPEFGRRWNSTCTGKPSAPPPSGASNLRWGARPPRSLKLDPKAGTDTLAVYVTQAPPPPLEGVKVADAKYVFARNRLTSAYLHIYGERERDTILSAYVEKYGTPQDYDIGAGRYDWKWPGSSISVSLIYNADEQKTTASFKNS